MFRIFFKHLWKPQKGLEEAALDLKNKSPKLMNSMLEKRPVPEAIMAKHKARKSMLTPDVPPTQPGMKSGECQKTKF